MGGPDAGPIRRFGILRMDDLVVNGRQESEADAVNLLRRRFGSEESGRDSRLATLLRSYPPYGLPFPGQPAELPLAQCEANLGYLLTERERRLESLAGLLGHFGVDLRAGLAADDPRPLLTDLEEWASEHWAGIYDRRLTLSREWLSSTMAGPDIVLSMLMDVAIVLGELILAKRPDFSWQLDLDEDNVEMPTHRRPVVFRPPLPDAAWPAVAIDVQAVAIGCYDTSGRRLPLVQALTRTVMSVIRGGYDPAD